MEVRRIVRRPTIIQVTSKSLGQDVARGKGEISDSQYILKVEAKGFISQLEVGY